MTHSVTIYQPLIHHHSHNLVHSRRSLMHPFYPFANSLYYSTIPTTPHNYPPLPKATHHYPQLPTTTHSHPTTTQSPTIIHSHPPPPPTTHSHPPSPPTVTHSHPSPPTATHSHPLSFTVTAHLEAPVEECSFAGSFSLRLEGLVEHLKARVRQDVLPVPVAMSVVVS